MRQIVRVVGVVVAGGFAATAITPPAAASIDGNRFQVTTRTIAEYENDVGRKGPSIGDSFTITEKLFHRGERVGHDAVYCQLSRVTKRVFGLQCVATLSLRGRGDITLQGNVIFKRGERTRPVLAITGGTGDYVGASGEVELVERRGAPTRLRVSLSG